MKNTNISVTVDSKNFEYKTSIKFNIKGLKVNCNGTHKPIEKSEEMPSSSSLFIGELHADLKAEGGAKGLANLVGNINKIKMARFDVGGENPFSGNDDIACYISAKDVSFSDKYEIARHITYLQDGSILRENIDRNDRLMSFDEVELEGSLKDVGEVIMQIMASIEESSETTTNKEFEEDKAAE